MRKILTALVHARAVRTAASPATAQAPAASLMGDMHRDVNEVQKKFIDLANAIPDAAYAWRPSAGARSVQETLLHVASDNYLIPISMGAPAPASSGITSDYNTATAFEKKQMTKAQIVAELEASFKHLHQAMGKTTDSNLAEMINMFGQNWTRQRAMVLTVTHLHEHLGQMIAYARANNVTPPWSR
jgi:uncharacterized damage-inducible protein DinB